MYAQNHRIFHYLNDTDFDFSIGDLSPLTSLVPKNTVTIPYYMLDYS